MLKQFKNPSIKLCTFKKARKFTHLVYIHGGVCIAQVTASFLIDASITVKLIADLLYQQVLPTTSWSLQSSWNTQQKHRQFYFH